MGSYIQEGSGCFGAGTAKSDQTSSISEPPPLPAQITSFNTFHPALSKNLGRYDYIVPNVTLYQTWRVSVNDFFFKRDSSDRTRGHQLTLKKSQVNGRLSQSSFCYRVVDLCNRLTTDVVSTPYVNVFKNRLDKLWKETMYELRQKD